MRVRLLFQAAILPSVVSAFMMMMMMRFFSEWVWLGLAWLGCQAGRRAKDAGGTAERSDHGGLRYTESAYLLEEDLLWFCARLFYTVGVVYTQHTT